MANSFTSTVFIFGVFHVFFLFIIYSQSVMAFSMEHDTDGDGIIDNSGFADNTFDCWIVTGPRSVG